MAKQFTVPPVTHRYRRIFKDVNGKRVARVDTTERQIVRADGSIEAFKDGENVELVDGVIWNPYGSQDGPSQIGGICALCRLPMPSWFRCERPRHGLCSRAGGEHCQRCGIFTCPRHRRWEAEAGIWLCLRCWRRHRRWAFVRSLFLVRAR